VGIPKSRHFFAFLGMRILVDDSRCVAWKLRTKLAHFVTLFHLLVNHDQATVPKITARQ